MPNNVLTHVDDIINKDYDIIKALDNDYTIETYTPELIIERGKIGFNIIPQQTITREFSAANSLPNLFIDIFMHYDMEADDNFKDAWKDMMTKANTVLQALYDKQNFIDGVSTVTVNIAFDNPIIEKERIVSLTFQCEYKIFATR